MSSTDHQYIVLQTHDTAGVEYLQSMSYLDESLLTVTFTHDRRKAKKFDTIAEAKIAICDIMNTHVVRTGAVLGYEVFTRDGSMTDSEIFDRFLDSTDCDRNRVTDYRSCSPFYNNLGIPEIKNAIIMQLENDDQIVYIPSKDMNGIPIRRKEVT